MGRHLSLEPLAWAQLPAFSWANHFPVPQSAHLQHGMIRVLPYNINKMSLQMR